MELANNLPAAQRRIRPHILRTPLVGSPVLSELIDAPVWMKLENLQVTGSFKVRGAANRLLQLTDAESRAGVITCSSGNHGRAVAHMAAALDIPATIVVPSWVDPVKLTAIRSCGAELFEGGSSYDEAESKALELARARGQIFIPPFDDEHVAVGQGTVAMEILEERPTIRNLVVPLSGGGLAGGVGLALKAMESRADLTAVSAESASVMYQSINAGRPLQLDEPPTLASALAGGIGVPNRVTFSLIQEMVGTHALVSESDIGTAIAYAYHTLGLIVEGGGAVGLAALLARKLPSGQETAIILSGGNLDLSVLHTILMER